MLHKTIDLSGTTIVGNFLFFWRGQLADTLSVTKLLEEIASYSQLAPQQGLAECCIVELDIVCSLHWLLFFFY